MRRGLSAAGLALVGAVVLSACGLDVNVEVDSTLDIHEDESGSRTVTAVLNEEDFEELDGGMDTVESAIEANIPESMTFEGISEDEDGDEGGYRGSFTLEFDDVEDYESKVASVLEAGDVDIDPEVNLNVAEEGLVTGISVDENFSGEDLMAWMPEALVEEDVIEEDQAGGLLTSGTGEVTFGEETYDTSGGQLRLDETEDHGFSGIRISTELDDSGTYTTDVTFVAPPDVDDDAEVLDQVENYLEGRIPEGGEYLGLGDGYDMVVRFEAESIEEVESGLQTALDNDDLTLNLEEKESAEGDEPLFVSEISGSGFVCDEGCSPYASEYAQFVMHLPDGWQVQGDSDDSYVSSSADSAEFEETVERPIDFGSVTADVDMMLNGNLDLDLEFTVENEVAEEHGDALEDTLNPDVDGATLETNEDSGNTVYSVNFDSQKPEDLQETLEEYAPGAEISSTYPSGFSVWPTYSVEVNLSSLNELIPVHTEGDTVDTTVNIPALHSEDSDAAGDSEDLVTSVKATGPSLYGLIFLGAIVAVVAALVYLLIRFRGKIAGTFRSGRDEDLENSENLEMSYSVASQFHDSTIPSQSFGSSLPDNADEKSDDAEGPKSGENSAENSADKTVPFGPPADQQPTQQFDQNNESNGSKQQRWQQGFTEDRLE